MIRTRRLTTALVFVVVAAAALLDLHAQSVQRTIFASVLDGSGAPAANVGPEDLVVREDNVAREILRVARADEPMQLAILVDNSQASESYIRDYRVALPGFVTELLGSATAGVPHRIALIGLASRPTIITDYTSNEADLLAGIQRIFAQADSGSYLLDGIIEISRGLAIGNVRRPVIVVLTTEGPELSDRHYDQVLEPLEESGAALHVIALGSPRNHEQDRSVVLSLGPRDSGGQYDTVLVGSALPARLKQLALELTQQYRVIYARPETLIPPERVTIEAARRDLTVRGAVVDEERFRGRP